MHSQLPQGLAPAVHRGQQHSVNSFLLPPSRQISGKFHQCSTTMTSLPCSELQSCLSNKIWTSAPGAFYASLGIVTNSFAALHGLLDLSFPTRDRTRPSAVKVPSPNHWTTREFPCDYFLYLLFLYSFEFSSHLTNQSLIIPIPCYR